MGLIEQLKENSGFQTLEEEELFVDALKRMAESKNKEYILIMLAYLDDDSEFTDIMKTIVGMSESFTKEDYVQAVIESVSDLEIKAADWLEMLHYRIMNSEEYTLAYKETLKTSKHQKEVIEYLERFLQNNADKSGQVESILGGLKS